MLKVLKPLFPLLPSTKDCPSNLRKLLFWTNIFSFSSKGRYTILIFLANLILYFSVVCCWSKLADIYIVFLYFISSNLDSCGEVYLPCQYKTNHCLAAKFFPKNNPIKKYFFTRLSSVLRDKRTEGGGRGENSNRIHDCTRTVQLGWDEPL